MAQIRWCVGLAAFLLLLSPALPAQKQKAKQQKPVSPAKKTEPARVRTTEDPAADEKKVRDIVTFLEFMLNTLGSGSTSTRDKDVLINESYSKIFRDANVQVEDDLDEERKVITNKDIVSYLKDINFFFKDVKFEFAIDKIDRGTNSDNHNFYKVSLHRNLKGTTADGKDVNNSIPRYVEVNFNPKDQDLKIVSIYSHEINEAESLRNWWADLSHEWKAVLQRKVKINDSVTLADVRRIVSCEELNLSNNRYIQSFEPLSLLKNLKVLDLSGTNIKELTSVRNLTGLLDLNIANTMVSDLSPLKYATRLEKLNSSGTSVSDVSVLQRMLQLNTLDLSGSKVADFGAISGLAALSHLNLKATTISELSAVATLAQLTELNISKTGVEELAPLKELKNLSILICDSTRIHSVSSLGELAQLKVLAANHTMVSDLKPLQKLAHLEKIYCDQTPIKKKEADAFMALRPEVLVVYDSYDLKAWWDALSPEWKTVISKAAKISREPHKEDLAKIDIVDSLNVSGNGRISDLTPLQKFQKLRVIVANKTNIHDLQPIRGHGNIEYLDISDTPVTDLSPLSQFKKLKELKADRCKIESIQPLQNSPGLHTLYVDEAGVNDINAKEFLNVNSNCLLVYKSVHLHHWWQNLPESWRAVFRSQLKDTARESMHRLVESEVFRFKDAPVTDLSGLSEFIRLRELNFSGTSITNLVPLENLTSLKSLQASDGPLLISEAIGQMADLENLDISNTPIEDLSPIWKLEKLKNLNCAGTQIKRLDALERMEGLAFLDCSNTNVTKLNALDYLPLKTLKCYNTRVSTKSIENFKASHPDCKVIYYR